MYSFYQSMAFAWVNLLTSPSGGNKFRNAVPFTYMRVAEGGPLCKCLGICQNNSIYMLASGD